MIRRARPVLVTGGTGQLGTELRRLAWPDGLSVIAPRRDQLDLTDSGAIAAAVAERPWAAVINAAAYTAVDRAEEDVTAAWRINALAPAAFAEACARAKVPLIQLSTDYVFPGDLPGAREVDDPVLPLNVYGASKLGGELAVRTSGARAVILRTAWVISAHGSNFAKTMLRLGAEQARVRVVADQRGAPTAAADLAHAIIAITARLVSDPSAPVGTFHFTNTGETSWASLAEEIFRQSAARGGASAMVDPVATADYHTAACRPANSLLSHRAIVDGFGVKPRAWQAALADILDELIGVTT